MQISTIGLDLAKRVFQVHGVDVEGHVILRRKLQRAEVARFFADLAPCVVGIEACATAHHWGRLIAIRARRPIDPAILREAVRPPQQDRCS